jgi:hypothetical protein
MQGAGAREQGTEMPTIIKTPNAEWAIAVETAWKQPV